MKEYCGLHFGCFLVKRDIYLIILKHKSDLFSDNLDGKDSEALNSLA